MSSAVDITARLRAFAERDCQASIDFQARVDKLRIDVAKHRTVPRKQLLAMDNEDKRLVDNLQNRVGEIEARKNASATDRSMLERLKARLSVHERLRAVITEVFRMMPAGEGLEGGKYPAQGGGSAGRA